MTGAGENDDWICHGWDDEIRGKLEHARSLTFRQKLEWLEEMGDMVAHFRRDPAWRRRNAAIEAAPATGGEPPAQPR